MSADLWTRFWSKVKKTDECWLFSGALIRDGYGSIYTGSRQTTLAHRLAYQWLVGPIPDGTVLDHLCRVRNCVRPDHLEPVTVAENNRRGVGGYNLQNGETCRNGLHPWPASAEAFSDGWSRCRECSQERYQRAYAKRVAKRMAAAS